MIALLSDFSQSEHVGIIKGILVSGNKNTQIIDISHNISKHSIIEGAWILFHSYRYFLKDTVFLCIVDPGVGTSRNAIAIKTKNYTFIGPDNGILFPSAIEDGIIESRIIPKANLSKTFEGRDLFAPAASQIEKVGIPSNYEKIKTIKPISFPLDKRDGIIVSLDSFGNVITNIPHIGKSEYTVKCKSFKKKLKFSETYESAKGIFLIKGSCNTIEISINLGNANKKLGFEIGNKISIS